MLAVQLAPALKIITALELSAIVVNVIVPGELAPVLVAVASG